MELNKESITKRKSEIEEKFIEVKASKLKLHSQAEKLNKSIGLVNNQMVELQNRYKEICDLLLLDVNKEAEKVEERFNKKYSQKSVDNKVNK